MDHGHIAKHKTIKKFKENRTKSSGSRGRQGILKFDSKRIIPENEN